MASPKHKSIIPVERIAGCIYLIRGKKVMLDADLAALYGVKTKAFNQAVLRNIRRFPEDFMFRLSKTELENWRSQIVTSNPAAKMGLRRQPYAFTEHGVAMLSSVLKSTRAVDVNIAIVRTFVRLREIMATHEELALKVSRHDRQIAVLFEHVKRLLEPPPVPKKHPIGFIRPKT